MRKILLILCLVFLFATILNANQKTTIQKDDVKTVNNVKISDFRHFYFNNNAIVDFAAKSADKRVKGFTGMAIAGTAVFGLSWFFIIPGIALMAYGYVYRWVEDSYTSGSYSSGYNPYYRYASNLSYSSSTYADYYEDWTLFYVGVGLLSLGLIFLAVGTPLMIVGWVLRTKYKKQISMFIDGNSRSSRIGLVFRF